MAFYKKDNDMVLEAPNFVLNKDYELKTDFNNFKNEVEALLVSNDLTLDELQEIVDFIKLNRADLDNLRISSIAGLQTALDAKTAELILHRNNVENPHLVTADQLGLGNVDNIADMNKPISTATQTALDLKADVTMLGLKSDTTHTHTDFSSLKVDTLRGKAVNNSSKNLDISQADLFEVVLTSGVNVLTLSNVPTDGSVITFILEVQNVTGSTISWWSDIKWLGGTEPTPTAVGTDVYGFYSKDGVTWRGALAHKDSK